MYLSSTAQTQLHAHPGWGTAREGELRASGLEAREVASFVHRYREASALPVTAADLDGRVRLFRIGREMVGGYRVSSPATRYSALTGEEAVQSWPFALDEAVEVTHLWMDPRLSSAARRAVYGWMLADVLASRKPFVLGGSIDAVLARQQQASLPQVLVDRPAPEYGAGRRLQVYYGTPRTLWANAMAQSIPLPWVHLR